MEHAHTKSVDDLVKYFKTDLELGLSDDQVEDYQNKYGFNGSFFINLPAMTSEAMPMFFVSIFRITCRRSYVICFYLWAWT